MIKSMTGFGAGSFAAEDYRVDVQIKTVNQRYFDAAFYMPKSLFALETELRNLIKQYVSRGKTEVRVAVKGAGKNGAKICVNRELAIGYAAALKELADLLKLPAVFDVKSVADIPQVLSVEEDDGEEESLARGVIAAAKDALKALKEMREREGRAIVEDFHKRLDYLSRVIDDELAGLSGTIVAEYRKRLERTIADVLAERDGEADAARLVQEVALYADRIDFTEEVVRLKSHLAQFSSAIDGDAPNADEPVGRKLDFLLQEINREVNTIASKANNVTAAQICVAVKSEIEKIREQVQNIE